jgi:hypothetical protein
VEPKWEAITSLLEEFSLTVLAQYSLVTHDLNVHAWEAAIEAGRIAKKDRRIVKCYAALQASRRATIKQILGQPKVNIWQETFDPDENKCDDLTLFILRDLETKVSSLTSQECAGDLPPSLSLDTGVGF